MSSRFLSLEVVIEDPVFPDVDMALRRGRHIDRDDGEWYEFISDAQDYLEKLYRRYGCELVAQSDGYFYLLPSGDKLSRRHMSAGEMLVGQVLALQYLDPATIKPRGVITRDKLLTRLSGLIGDLEIAKVLDPRRKRFDNERVIHEAIRRRVAEALRCLDGLGFVKLIGQDRMQLRSPLLRFTDPVRGLQDSSAALERLIARGEIIFTGDETAEAENAELDYLPGEDDPDEGGESYADEEVDE